MFLILLTYLVPEENVIPFRAAHYEFADKLFTAGTFLLGGRRVPATGGFILAHGTTRAELDGLLSEDPYLRAGVAQHEVMELMPTRVAPQLAEGLGLSGTGSAITQAPMPQGE